jgi:hypothetical protein
MVMVQDQINIKKNILFFLLFDNIFFFKVDIQLIKTYYIIQKHSQATGEKVSHSKKTFFHWIKKALT